MTGIKEFSGGYDRFHTIGDEEGLFICVNKDIKGWFPTFDKAYISEFELHFTVKGADYRIVYKEDEITALEA